ncbi:DUF565 domain-containing protein [Prochlorococcus sp. MIT 1307]|uniref:DUF565 domain-containing protein n=1 Tax=Prochlorococcus sp. MIT 1307 TaxID=3096219 RepID=UPI002A75CB29|nr:DUF565 domain-containing protein [Prochlorococcus sp. MIT 1307]
MTKRLQSTNLHKSFGKAFERLEDWAINPWRRYSILLIVLLIGFFLGSSIGMINGTLALMDPVGAFFTVLILEVMVRLRRNWQLGERNSLSLELIDSARIGILYGLLLEGFKLL